MKCGKIGCPNDATYAIQVRTENRQQTPVNVCCDDHVAEWRTMQADGTWRNKLNEIGGQLGYPGMWNNSVLMIIPL